MKKALIEACEYALRKMESGHKNKKYGNTLEKPFQDFLGASLLKAAKFKFSREVPLENIEAKQGWADRKKGKMDFILNNKVGVEIKVIRLPRAPDKLGSFLFDIGQLSLDWMRISEAKKLDSGMLMLLVHGPLVSDLIEQKSSRRLKREIHNRFFTDYQTSIQYGHLNTEKKRQQKERIIQIKGMEAMRIHLPYPIAASEKRPIKDGFVVMSEQKNYAVITIPVTMKPKVFPDSGTRLR